MSSRERKRAERRKRKQRAASADPIPPEAEADAAAAKNGSAPEQPTGTENVEDLAVEADAREISRSELRNERAREALEPLEEDERPLVVTLGALVSLLIGGATAIAWLVGTEVDGERPNAVQAFAPAILFCVMGYGMLRKRYWAVLGFQAVMGIILVGAFITLVAAATLGAALTATAIIAVAGAFFWFTVKALARIQMPDRTDRPLR